MTVRKGFTLIELLVVIAIIAVLMGILMPSLKKAREQARGVACLSNQKTIALAYIMYASEHDGSVAGGWARKEIQNGVPPWVMPPLDYSGTDIVDMGGSGVSVTIEQRYNGLREGALYAYIKDVGAYHCPGDNRIRLGTSRSAEAGYLIYRSYSLPDYLRATDPRDKKKLFSFKNAARKMLFVEEIYNGGAGNHNAGGWSYDPELHALWDELGIFHSNASTFSFMDGHAERKKWGDPRTIIYCENRDKAASLGFGKNVDFNPHNLDLDWLDDHYPGPTYMP